jgi:uncharacterized 2Fe-2S/4Fe-4S cluster protein (DUF4445 family)
MGGIPGAINKIEMKNGALSFTTIGNSPPRGICGCGLIDAIAVMRSSEIIDETGALSEAYSEGFPITGSIRVINRDIRQYQLAKSAILSGIQILCKNAGLEPAGVPAVFIAGGLGFFIDKQNAVIAGLFPKEFRDKITLCGNLSLQGAIQCLSESAFLENCKHIRAHSKVLELAADPSFMDAFAENMFF